MKSRAGKIVLGAVALVLLALAGGAGFVWFTTIPRGGSQTLNLSMLPFPVEIQALPGGDDLDTAFGHTQWMAMTGSSGLMRRAALVPMRLVWARLGIQLLGTFPPAPADWHYTTGRLWVEGPGDYTAAATLAGPAGESLTLSIRARDYATIDIRPALFDEASETRRVPNFDKPVDIATAATGFALAAPASDNVLVLIEGAGAPPEPVLGALLSGWDVAKLAELADAFERSRDFQERYYGYGPEPLLAEAHRLAGEKAFLVALHLLAAVQRPATEPNDYESATGPYDTDGDEEGGP